jgi:hypothetical protein
LGTDPSNPWNTKKETSREGIRRIYADFFSNAADMAVEYTDRIIDVENRSAAVVVRVSMESGGMENALHIKWNDRGEIILFYNWYGAGVEKI